MQSMNTCQKQTVSIIGTERGGEFQVCWRRHGRMLPTRGELSCQRGFDCWQGNRGGCACGRWGQRECLPCTFVQVGLSWNQILVTAGFHTIVIPAHYNTMRCLDEKEKAIGLHRECTPRQGKDLIPFEVG